MAYGAHAIKVLRRWISKISSLPPPAISKDGSECSWEPFLQPKERTLCRAALLSGAFWLTFLFRSIRGVFRQKHLPEIAWVHAKFSLASRCFRRDSLTRTCFTA